MSDVPTGPRLAPAGGAAAAAGDARADEGSLRLLYAAFVVSGAAGLMYEAIWSRYLGLFVGHGAYAQILVLVIFLGGMSLGAALVGRCAERVRDPLLWYALVEAVVGAIAVVFHPLYVGVTDAAYDALFARLPAGAAVLAAKWTIAALLILPQSVLLGTTFPLMTAGVLRRARARPGRVLAILYFANSLGAAAGVLLAGFALLAWVGLPGTLLAAAACNALVAAVAWGVSRAAPAPDAPPHDAPPHDAAPHDDAPAAAAAPVPRALVRTLLAVAFGTAAASFVYEIAWIRMLSLVLGSATHSFELMLSAFILGLALGAWWVRARADRWADPLRALGRTQWVMGALAIGTLPVYLATFPAMAWLLDALDLTPAGYQLFAGARYLLCLLVMLPATFCAGITLPLITRILLARGGGAASAGERAIGQVYAVNTLGSILGAALAGLVLMPLLGLKWLLVAGAFVDIGLGIWLLARVDALRGALRGAPPAAREGDDAAAAGARGRRAGRARPLRRAWDSPVTDALVGAAILVVLAASVPLDRAVLTSGVYRYATVSAPGDFVVPFYRDGRTATVSVRRHRRANTLTLATNGKPDASLALDWIRPGPADTVRRALTGDQITQALLPLVTLAHAPAARTAAVIGQGSGVTSHLLLGSPRLARLETIDIEPEMIRGSRQFYPANRRVFDDPRSRFVIDDAKAHFASARRTYDVIVSEPSNPWVSGVSGLFTDEFYARVRRYLAPGGVFGQWLHLYEIDDRLVLSVLAALHRHFPSYTVYLASNADILVVARADGALPAPDWGVVALPGIAADLRRVHPLDPASLAGLRLADRAALAPLLDRYQPVNSDFHPVLDLGAERTRFLRRSATGFRALQTGRFDMLAAMRGWRVPFAVAPEAPFDVTRATARARGAALGALWAAHRAMPGGEAPWLPLPADDTGWLRDALYRRATYEQVVASGRPPVDWHRFVTHALDVHEDLHGGTAGVLDTAFHDRLAAYLAAQRAPRQAAAAAAFVRGLAGHDFAAAAAAAPPLIDAAGRGDRWLDVELLHDGAVVAALRAGDRALALRVARTVAPLLRRRGDDLRSALVPAWIAAAAR